MNQHVYKRLRMIIGLAALSLLVNSCAPPPPKNLPPRNLEICCFGDSLVAGVGASDGSTKYPAQLAEILNASVVNWGTSGDTTQDGLAKLNKFNNATFGIVVVTLGGNDILQRVNWNTTKANLEKMFTTLTDQGAVVVFTGVTGPLNPTRNKHYRKLCEAHGVIFVSDILDGITRNPDMLSDEIHPNDAGYRLMAERVAEKLQENGLFSTE